MLFDVSIDESGDVASGSTRLIGSLRDGEGGQEFIEHLHRLLVLALGVGRVRGHGIHVVDRGHLDKRREGFRWMV